MCDVLTSAKPSRTYRLSQNVRPLIWVECTVEKHSRSRTEYLVKARSQFKERSSASNVEIFLPLPQDAITPTVRASQVCLCYPQPHWHHAMTAWQKCQHQCSAVESEACRTAYYRDFRRGRQSCIYPRPWNRLSFHASRHFRHEASQYV